MWFAVSSTYGDEVVSSLTVVSVADDVVCGFDHGDHDNRALLLELNKLEMSISVFLAKKRRIHQSEGSPLKSTV